MIIVLFQRSISTLPMDRRPKSRISQHSVPRAFNHSAATTSATASIATAPNPRTSTWKNLKISVTKSTANCFRCCKGGRRRRKHATSISGKFRQYSTAAVLFDGDHEFSCIPVPPSLAGGPFVWGFSKIFACLREREFFVIIALFCLLCTTSSAVARELSLLTLALCALSVTFVHGLRLFLYCQFSYSRARQFMNDLAILFDLSWMRCTSCQVVISPKWHDNIQRLAVDDNICRFPSPGHANHSRINRSDSQRQQLVYSSASDDNAFPGATVHMWKDWWSYDSVTCVVKLMLFNRTKKTKLLLWW